MIKPILQVGADVLSQETVKVTDFDSPNFKKLLVDLKDTCIAGQEFTAGLAAPQIGSNLSVTLINRLDLEKETELDEKKQEKPVEPKVWEYLINPTVKPTNNQDSMFWEACLSVGVGDKQLWGPVWRPEKVVVDYQDETGKHKSLSADGFFAHLIQHEIDHLQGILFISRVQNPEMNLWRAKELNVYLEKYDNYPAIK